MKIVSPRIFRGWARLAAPTPQMRMFEKLMFLLFLTQFLNVGALRAADKYDEYNSLSTSHATSSDFDRVWQEVEEAKKARNASFAFGGVFLATGIGVHIWF